MNISGYLLFFIILGSIIVGLIIGAILCFWYVLHTVKKATGVKSWKEFINQVKKAQELQKRMEKEGILGVMNDPKLRKQIEELQKRFGGKSK